MKLKIQKFFHGLLAGCLVFGFPSACGAVQCIGADGRVIIEMTCGVSSGLPQQHGADSFPQPAGGAPDQGEDAGCGQCAMDLPIPGIADGVCITPPSPSLLLPPVWHWSALPAHAAVRGRGPAVNTDFPPDHSLALLRTTVLLI